MAEYVTVKMVHAWVARDGSGPPGSLRKVSKALAAQLVSGKQATYELKDAAPAVEVATAPEASEKAASTSRRSRKLGHPSGEDKTEKQQK